MNQLLLISLLERLRLSPDADGSSAGTENTGDPAGDGNTGPDDGQQSANRNAGINQEQRQRFINVGMGRGVTKTLASLGFETDQIDEALEELTRLRSGAGKQGSQQEPVDIASHPQFVDLASKFAKLENQHGKLERDHKVASERADIARQLAVKQAAIEHGIGAGKQADAFLRMYGDKFAFDDDGQLAVVSHVNGAQFTGVQTIEEVFTEVSGEADFLFAPERATGSNSRQGPTRDGNEKPKSERDQWRSRHLAAMGITDNDTPK